VDTIRGGRCHHLARAATGKMALRGLPAPASVSGCRATDRDALGRYQRSHRSSAPVPDPLRRDRRSTRRFPAMYTVRAWSCHCQVRYGHPAIRPRHHPGSAESRRDRNHPVDAYTESEGRGVNGTFPGPPAAGSMGGPCRSSGRPLWQPPHRSRSEPRAFGRDTPVCDALGTTRLLIGNGAAIERERPIGAAARCGC